MQQNRIYERVRVGECCTVRGCSGGGCEMRTRCLCAHTCRPRTRLLLSPGGGFSCLPPDRVPSQGCAAFRGPAGLKERGVAARPPVSNSDTSPHLCPCVLVLDTPKPHPGGHRPPASPRELAARCVFGNHVQGARRPAQGRYPASCRAHREP